MLKRISKSKNISSETQGHWASWGGEKVNGSNLEATKANSSFLPFSFCMVFEDEAKNIINSCSILSYSCITWYRIKTVLSNMACVHWRSYNSVSGLEPTTQIFLEYVCLHFLYASQAIYAMNEQSLSWSRQICFLYFLRTLFCRHPKNHLKSKIETPNSGGYAMPT